MSDSLPDKLSRSWLLFRTSLQVIRDNPKLLLFPVVTAVCTGVIMLFFFAPALLYRSGQPLGQAAHWETLGRRAAHPTGYFYGYLAVVYLTSMFLATFFNAAFYNEILKALAGDPVSIRSGLASAWSRVHSILMWSLLAGTVGLIIKALEERFGWIGRWALKFVGVVWSVASIFAIPVIIREGTTNPFSLLRQSAGILRKTWGESLAGYVGIAAGSWLLLLGSLLFLGLTVGGAIALDLPLLAVGAALLWLAALLVVSYLATVAGHVYRCALYVYASEGVVPAPYTPALMDAAWKIKKA